MRNGFILIVLVGLMLACGEGTTSDNDGQSPQANPNPTVITKADGGSAAERGDSEIWVYPLEDAQLDAAHVQWAVDNVSDNGGTVVLKATDREGHPKAFFFANAEKAPELPEGYRLVTEMVDGNDADDPRAFVPSAVRVVDAEDRLVVPFPLPLYLHHHATLNEISVVFLPPEMPDPRDPTSVLYNPCGDYQAHAVSPTAEEDKWLLGEKLDISVDQCHDQFGNQGAPLKVLYGSYYDPALGEFGPVRSPSYPYANDQTVLVRDRDFQHTIDCQQGYFDSEGLPYAPPDATRTINIIGEANSDGRPATTIVGGLNSFWVGRNKPAEAFRIPTSEFGQLLGYLGFLEYWIDPAYSLFERFSPVNVHFRHLKFIDPYMSAIFISATTGSSIQHCDFVDARRLDFSLVMKIFNTLNYIFPECFSLWLQSPLHGETGLTNEWIHGPVQISNCYLDGRHREDPDDEWTIPFNWAGLRWPYRPVYSTGVYKGILTLATRADLLIEDNEIWNCDRGVTVVENGHRWNNHTVRGKTTIRRNKIVNRHQGAPGDTKTTYDSVFAAAIMAQDMWFNPREFAYFLSDTEISENTIEKSIDTFWPAVNLDCQAGATVSRNTIVIEDNLGAAITASGGSRDCTIKDNVVSGNAVAGIITWRFHPNPFFEDQIQNNMILNNDLTGFVPIQGAALGFGGHIGLLDGSIGNVVEDNLLNTEVTPVAGLFPSGTYHVVITGQTSGNQVTAGKWSGKLEVLDIPDIDSNIYLYVGAGGDYVQDPEKFLEYRPAPGGPGTGTHTLQYTGSCGLAFHDNKPANFRREWRSIDGIPYYLPVDGCPAYPKDNTISDSPD